MGMQMRLYPAPDPDLRAFSIAPMTLKAWLRYANSLPEVSLREAWKDLDALLAGAPGASAASPLSPAGADWRFPDAADRGAHALSSGSTAVLLRAIENIDRPQVERFLTARLTGAGEGDSPPLPPEELARTTDELLGQLAKLRESCTEAVRRGYGLLMAFWD